MPEDQADLTSSRCLAHPPLERRYYCWPGPPGDMESRHRVAGTRRPVAASLRPTDDREEPDPVRTQPRPFFAGREGDISLGPLSRPLVLFPIESRRGHPVPERSLVGVPNTEPALLRRVDEEDAAERPVGLPAEPGLRFLLQQDHASAAVREFGGGDQPRESGAH